jgi:hypothetical protein
MAQVSSVPNWWQSWMTPTIILAFVAWVWIAMRPALVRLLYYLLCLEPKKFEDTILSTLESKSGRVRFKAYSLEVHAERVKAVDERIDEALNIANANKDSLTKISEVQLLQGRAITGVQESVRDVPKLTDSMDRVSRSIEIFAKEMKAMGETMIRLEERQAANERRRAQTPDGPRRRASDEDDETRR